MRGRKRFSSALLCLILLAALPLPALAEEGESVYRAVIEDGAELLTEAEESELSAVMEKVLPYGNAALVTVSENPTTPEQFSQDRFIELFGDADGIIFVIDMDNRYVQLSSHGGTRRKIGKARCEEITDNVYTYASRGDYLGCASNAFEQAARVLEGQRIAAPFRYVTNAFLAICLALLGNFAIMSLQRRRKVAPENALGVRVVVNSASTAVKTGAVAAVALTMLDQRRTKHVESSSSGGGHSGGGGGFSGGGHSGGGGGFSGGGHRF